MLPSASLGPCAALGALHGAPGWRRACGCADGEPWGAFARDPSPTGLPDPTAAAPWPPPTDWQAFYRARGLDAGSPAALLLHRPLTAVVAAAAAGASPASSPPPCIHVLGSRVECDEWPAWREVAAWLPGCSLCFVGLHVPEALDGARFDLPGPGGKSITMHFTRGEWHAVRHRLPPPTVGVACDAGLAAYASWAPTLTAWLGTTDAPVTITEHCEEAGVRAAAAVAAAAPRARVVGPTLNQFRSPVALRVPGAGGLPAACGGFAVTAVGGGGGVGSEN